MTICRHVRSPRDLAQLAAVSKYLNPIATEALYKRVALRSPLSLRSFHFALKKCPHYKSLIRVLNIEWIEDNWVQVPKSMGRWFFEIMDALKDGKVEHLSVIILPDVLRQPNPGCFHTHFEGPMRRFIVNRGLTGINIPQSVHTFDVRSEFLAGYGCLMPGPTRDSGTPLTALSLRVEACLMLEQQLIPRIDPWKETIRRLRFEVRDAVETHPLLECRHIKFRLPNVEYLEIAHVGLTWMVSRSQ